MQNARSIVCSPIVPALLLSVTAHAVMLYSRTISMPATPQIDVGKTVIQLTLMPSVASAPIPEPVTPELSRPSGVGPVLPDSKPIEEPVDTPPAPLSAEQDATPDTEKGVTANAMANGTFRPAYPRISRRRGEEGTVSLSVVVHGDGSVGEVSVLQSSGYRRLDDAALKAAKQTMFNPALLLGRAVESTTQLSYTFRLTND